MDDLPNQVFCIKLIERLLRFNDDSLANRYKFEFDCTVPHFQEILH